MDLFGPTRTTSLRGKRYGFMIINDFSRFTWILFLASKDEVFSKFYRKILNEKGLSIISIHSDHGIEFKNKDFKKFYDEKKIDHNFFIPRTSQQNGIVERKYRIFEKMIRTMLCKSKFSKYFWVEAINTVYYILNHALKDQF